MYGTFQKHVADELAGIEEAGLTKHERGIRGPQNAEITADGAEVLNFCANNYLGLADDPRILDAATTADKLALIRAHPELAGKAAIAKSLTAESNAEQASAGLDMLTPEEFARFHELNTAYGQRFGFPFIIAVRLNDKSSILAAMQARLANDEAAEVAEAIQQIGLISKLRLLDAVTQ